jgi:cysteine desulfurase
MNVPDEMAGSFLRVSFGPYTSEADVDRFLDEWRRIRSRSTAEAA